MRRTDREIADQAEIDSILNESDACRLALADGEWPYAVTLNYGWERAENGSLTLYFHCAREGKKLDLVDATGKAAFVIDTGHGLVTGERACDWSMNYRSVAGRGKIRRAKDDEERKRALALVMKHYAGREMDDFDARVLAMTEVLALETETVTGKKRE